MNKCENEKIKKSENIKNLSLLIMENGGDNLEIVSDNISKLEVNDTNIKMVELILIELHNVFMGLKTFIDNNIVHHDLKPQNLVYNALTNKINFIDFGLMTNENRIKEGSKNSIYSFSTNHWSFPFEMYYYNYNRYVRFCNENNKIRFFNELNNGFSTTSVDENINNMVKSLKTLFSYIACRNNLDDSKKYMNELYDTLLYSYKIDQYDEFLDNSIKSIDLYGTGIACIYFCIMTEKFLNTSLKNDLHSLFYQMIRPNFYKRIKINDLINQYETILENHNIISKYNKQFKNHVLVDENIQSKGIKKNIKKLNNKKLKISSEERKRNTNAPIKICPPDKELNINTSRCVKKCEKDYVRNDKFKCTKKCTGDKVLNPVTKRCVSQKYLQKNKRKLSNTKRTS